MTQLLWQPESFAKASHKIRVEGGARCLLSQYLGQRLDPEVKSK
ncbi:hypothetical protein SAMN05428950_1011939 [Sphingomonas sp. OV641]|nr:hypothetical protein SAMN05428950_1011939 [Sphingomonas sp. OV641]